MTEDRPGNSRVLIALFRHNTWANLRLLDFCARLSDEQLDTGGVGVYGTISATLLHIVRAEVGYVHRVNGKWPAEEVPEDPFPGFRVLKDTVRWSGEELPQLALAARAETLVRETEPGDPVGYEFPLSGLLFQAINHATEHRAQISAIITQLGIEPPEMDGWVYMEETGQAHEFQV